MKLIDKDALVAEIERKADIICQGVLSEEATMSVEYFKDSLISFLDILKVKEVDLEKHLKEDIEDIFFDLNGVVVKGATHYLTVEDVKDIAKHFFELGTCVNSIEVKKVDLEKEISFQWSKFCLNGKDKDSFVEVAKHFFKLGLKAQEGE